MSKVWFLLEEAAEFTTFLLSVKNIKNLLNFFKVNSNQFHHKTCFIEDLPLPDFIGNQCKDRMIWKFYSLPLRHILD